MENGKRKKELIYYLFQGTYWSLNLPLCSAVALTMVLYLSLFNCFLLKTKKQTKEDVKKNLMGQTCAFIRRTRDGSPASEGFF